MSFHVFKLKHSKGRGFNNTTRGPILLRHSLIACTSFACIHTALVTIHLIDMGDLQTHRATRTQGQIPSNPQNRPQVYLIKPAHKATP